MRTCAAVVIHVVFVVSLQDFCCGVACVLCMLYMLCVLGVNRCQSVTKLESGTQFMHSKFQSHSYWQSLV